MKKILSLLLIALSLSFTLSAEETAAVISSKTLNGVLDLQSEGYVRFYFASPDNLSAPISEITLSSNTSSLPAITAVGDFAVVWDVVNSSGFELMLYSASLASQSFTAEWNSFRSDGSLLVGRLSGYNGTIYTHDPSAAIGNSGQVIASVVTEDLGFKLSGDFSTTLKLELKMK